MVFKLTHTMVFFYNTYLQQYVLVQIAACQYTSSEVSNEPGYYKITTPMYFKTGTASNTNSMEGVALAYGNAIYFEYLGKSYQVDPNVSVVELKDASDEVKAANNYAGETSINALVNIGSTLYGIKDTVLSTAADDIVYITGGSRAVTFGGSPKEYPFSLESGYYKCIRFSYGWSIVDVSTNKLQTDAEYLGTSYLVKEE